MEPTFTGYLRLIDAEALARGETVRVWLHPQEHVIQMIIPITWVRGRESSFLLVGPPPSPGTVEEAGLPEEVLTLLAEASTVRSRLTAALGKIEQQPGVPREMEERIRDLYVAVGRDIDRLRLQTDTVVQAKLTGELRDRFAVARHFLAQIEVRPEGE